MRKTIYSVRLAKEDKTYWYGDKLLRVAFVITHIIEVITHIIELALIIYLLVR